MSLVRRAVVLAALVVLHACAPTGQPGVGRQSSAGVRWLNGPEIARALPGRALAYRKTNPPMAATPMEPTISRPMVSPTRIVGYLSAN